MSLRDRTDLVTEATPRTQIVAERYFLTVVEGPGVGNVLSVDDEGPSRLFIGQSPVCHVKVTDPKVSRRHAAFELSKNGLRVIDLGSTNGTFIGAVSVTDGFAHPGDFIRLGSTVLKVSVESFTSSPLPTATNFGKVLGVSPAMRKLYGAFERLAASDVPVVIEGETGTGKELLAESIHEASARAKYPFVVLDASAIPPGQIEAVLFGTAGGAVGGAGEGLVDNARGGTLFIDEVADFDLSLQPKLLRLIDRSEYRRVDGQEVLQSNVRVIAATRRDLDHEVATGKFRDDLFFRLAVAHVALPPLRKRDGDAAFLMRQKWKEMTGGASELPSELLFRHEGYGWPGNVRELVNVLARYQLLGTLLDPSASDAPARLGESSGDVVGRVVDQMLPFSAARQQVVDAFERRYVARLLEKHGGNVTQAAAASGLARRYFQLVKARQK